MGDGPHIGFNKFDGALKRKMNEWISTKEMRFSKILHGASMCSVIVTQDTSYQK